jgi:phosphoribosyl-AMP cyclohydrolase / phosphoribosyl-ATP pyrophosphohydrolase
MEELTWDANGLIPVVVQDERTKDVVMVAYMNQEAFDLTLKTKKAHYYSRSRRKIWLKGETSGHFQEVKSIRLDCDNDTLLLLVDQKVAACHTGYWSCFYRAWENEWKVVGEKVFDEKSVYSDGRNAASKDDTGRGA